MGKSNSGLGFGMGLERLMLVLTAQNIEIPKPSVCQLYLGSIGEAATLKTLELVQQLRKDGYYAECDVMGRSVKAQMKYANKIGARLSAVIGDSELENQTLVLKDMQSGETIETTFPAFLKKCMSIGKKVSLNPWPKNSVICLQKIK